MLPAPHPLGTEENVHRLDTRVVLAAIRSKEDAGEAGALTALKLARRFKMFNMFPLIKHIAS